MWCQRRRRSSDDSTANQKRSARLYYYLTGDLALKDGVLVPEHGQFGVFGGVTVQQH
jgi:hypothetical protein